VALNPTPPTEAPDAEAVSAAEAMLTRFVDSWNAADGFAYGEGYWDDAELVDPSGRISSGRNAIAQGHVDAWSGSLKGSRVSGKTRRIQRLGPDFLIVDLDMELALIQEYPSTEIADDAGVIRTHLKHILAKRDGVWRILSAQNTFITRG
jgi:uncharacterized protein (TIGR02246 family)